MKREELASAPCTWKDKYGFFFFFFYSTALGKEGAVMCVEEWKREVRVTGWLSFRIVVPNDVRCPFSFSEDLFRSVCVLRKYFALTKTHFCALSLLLSM